MASGDDFEAVGVIHAALAAYQAGGDIFSADDCFYGNGHPPCSLAAADDEQPAET